MTLDEAVDELEGWIRDRKPRIVCCVNVALLMWSRELEWLHEWFRHCDLLISDGRGIFFGSYLVGRPLAAPVNQEFVMWELLRRAAIRGYRVYVLGTTPEVLALALDKLPELFPGLNVVGSHHGFFTEVDEPAIFAEIRRLAADVVIVGITTVRKEAILRRNLERLQAPVVLGVGGSLDIVAGIRRGAPMWVRTIGMEWLFRFIQEPGRLWRRYSTTNFAFLLLVLKGMSVRLVRRLTAERGRRDR